MQPLALATNVSPNQMDPRKKSALNHQAPYKPGALSTALRACRVLIVALVSLLFPSHSNADPSGTQPLGEAYFNRTAGRGGFLFVNVRLEDRRELPFMLDTGCPVTVFDSSLESCLGEVLSTNVIPNGWRGYWTNHLFKAPKLYLGGVELHGGRQVWAHDVKGTYAAPPLMGVLGFDYLRQCRLQLDFSRCRLSLLTSDQWQTNVPRDSFQLSLKPPMNLLGVKGARTIVDTGDYQDGALDAKTFQAQIQAQGHGSSVQTWAGAAGKPERLLHLPELDFEHHTYTNVILEDCASSSDQQMNLIGLRFLARHLVTFDFPNNQAYLKQNSIGPLIDTEAEAGLNYLRNLKQTNQLPGFSKDDKASVGRHRYESGFFAGTYPVSLTYEAKKQSDQSVYHYTISRSVANQPWMLQKAWRTGPGGADFGDLHRGDIAQPTQDQTEAH